MSLCGKEFTAKDEAERNFTESMGVFKHQICPGIEVKCAICGKPITEFSQAKRTPTMGWQHKDCKPVAIKRSTAREQALRESRNSEEKPSASCSMFLERCVTVSNEFPKTLDNLAYYAIL